MGFLLVYTRHFFCLGKVSEIGNREIMYLRYVSKCIHSALALGNQSDLWCVQCSSCGHSVLICRFPTALVK